MRKMVAGFGRVKLFSLSSCRDREHSSRFAIPGSFEYEFGQKWKALYQLHKDQEELLKRNFNEEVAKLEMDMETAQLEQHTVKMRQGALSVVMQFPGPL